jgi:CubicO group peptidase (beta-lactamase class C family)
VWRESDVDDIDRFPARAIAAGPTALPLSEGRLPAGTLDVVAGRDGAERPLDRLVQRSGTEALLVLRDDEVVYERYANGGAADRPHTSFSVAKSFLSTLVGIAIDRGEIERLDAPVTDHVPELLERDERFADVTLRHLLTMSSGLVYEERGLPWSDDATTYYAPDLRAEAISTRVGDEPGRRWHYNNFNPLLVGLVLERATGTSVSDYMERHLWQAMGAEAEGSWSLDSEDSGFEKMESGVNALARDYARFGYLFAHDGQVAGRQVVSADWVREATARDTSRDPADHYQYWWWVDTERPERFFARGNFGQYVYVDPASDVVVVRLGRDDGGEDWPGLLRDVADRVNAAG